MARKMTMWRLGAGCVAGMLVAGAGLAEPIVPRGGEGVRAVAGSGVEARGFDEARRGLGDGGSSLFEWTVGGARGVGGVAVAERGYSVGGDDLMVLERRSAAIRLATLEAKVALAEYLRGLDVSSAQRVVETMVEEQRDTLERLEMTLSASDRQASAVRAMVRGAVVAGVEDDRERGVVRVSVVATPSSGGVMFDAGGGVLVSGDVEGAVEGVLYALSLGSLPMSGSRAVVDARTGRVTWVSFGGAAVGDEASPTRNQLGIRRARMRAIGAMASALLGEEVSGESMVEEEREEYTALETRFDGGAGGGDVRELVLRTVAESDRRAATGGAIPAGVVSLPFWSEDQRVRYHAMVYRSEEVIPGLAERLGASGRGASPVVVERPERVVEAPVVSARFGRLDKGVPVCGLPGEANGPFERVRVLGRGKDGSAAFKDALQQALMQVNGATVASDERYSESITALMTNTELLEEVQSSQLLDVSVETNGAVLRFAECSPVREVVGGEFVADLVVDVLSYGDGEWRSVPTAAVVVLPIGQMIGSHADELRRDILQQTAQDRADGALAGSGAYRALTRSKMLVLDQELQRVKDWVGAGESPMRELVNLGQKLGSDRMLMVSVRRVEHDTQEVFVRVRNRTETQERLSVEVTVQEIVTATGEINASDTVRGYWTGAELDGLKREFGVGPGLVSAAIERLVDRALSGVMGHSAEKRTGGLVVGHEEGTVYFRMSGGVWAEGEVLRVLAQAGDGGELFPVGEVVVEFVSGLTGMGRLVKGRAPEGAVLVKGGS